MLTILIGIVAFVVIYAAAADGHWGSVVLGIVIVLVLIGMSSQERKDWRAYENYRDYWANGGPNRRR